MKIGWRFPPLSSGPKQGYTNYDIEGFKGEELIDNLAREICQNSLDERDKSGNPVRVVFKLRQMERCDYKVFSEYAECINGCRRYWSRGGTLDSKLKTFLDDAEATLNKRKINVLVASDYNTRGLVGNHNLDDITSPWEALTSADGMSVKPDGNSGGSFGIGKNAPFACSSLSMVFYNTFDEENQKAFVGVGRVATLLNREGKPTQRVGKYQKNDEENDIWLPIYEEDEDNFRDQFYRNEKGTDVIIVGFNEVDSWEDNVSKAVIKNFFVAIKERRLVVEIENGDFKRIINDNTLGEIIEYFSKTDSDLETTRQLYAAYLDPDNENVKITVMDEKDAAEIYIKSESSYSRTIANFRSTGMLVGKGYRRIFQHYAAVLIVRGQKLGALLRDCEPPRHNRWDYKLIQGNSIEQKERRKLAKEVLDYLDKELLRILKLQYEIPAGDSIDAVGVSAYLPDNEDGAMSEESEGTDILKAKVKIGKSKVKKNKSDTFTMPGIDADGKNIGGDTGNGGFRKGENPNPKPGPFPGPEPGPEPGPNPGPSPNPIVETDGEGTVKGTAQGIGSRRISLKELNKRRIFPMAANMGIYKIVVLPNRNYERLFIECTVAGEDGNADQININRFMFNGKSFGCKGNKAGPVKVTAGIPAEFIVTFDQKEKLGLNLILSEGGEL